MYPVVQTPEECPEFSNEALDETGEEIKTSGGVIVSMNYDNSHTDAVFIQFFDALLTDVTIGTTAPTYSFAIEAGADTIVFPHPLKFRTAISWAATSGRSNNTAPGADPDVAVRGSVV